MGNATTANDYLSRSGRTGSSKRARLTKPLFIPTPLQMVLQLQEWKRDLNDWKEEHVLIERLVLMTRLSGRLTKVYRMFSDYNEFMNRRISMLQNRIDEYEAGLKDREIQLLPQKDVAEFEALQMAMKKLKKQINELKLPVLKAIVQFYPVDIF